MAGEEITPTPEPAPAAEARPEGLEQRLTRAMGDDVGDGRDAPGRDESPTQDGLPIEPGPAATPAGAESGWQSVKDYAKQSGVELPYETDAAALNALIRSHQQLQERNAYAEMGQRLSPHIGRFQEYLRQQQQPPPGATRPWEPPPYDEKWLAMVERDEATGVLRAKAGYDPAIAEKLQAVAEWRDRYQKNPEAVIAPLIEDRARGLIEERFAEYQQQQTANELVQRNRPWAVQHDANGRPLADPRTGGPQLTPLGVVYAQATDALWRAGMRDVRQVDLHARAAAENYALRARFQQEQPAATPPPAQQAALAAPSVGGGAGRGRTPGTPPPAVSRKGMTLQEKLRVALADAPEDMTFGRSN